eukprot:gene19798-21739_t
MPRNVGLFQTHNNKLVEKARQNDHLSYVAIRKNGAHERQLSQELESIDSQLLKLDLEKKKIAVARQKFRRNLNTYKTTCGLSKSIKVVGRNVEETSGKRRTDKDSGNNGGKTSESIAKEDGQGPGRRRERCNSLPSISNAKYTSAFSDKRLKTVINNSQDFEGKNLPLISQRRQSSLGNLKVIQEMIQIKKASGLRLVADEEVLFNISPKTSKRAPTKK